MGNIRAKGSGCASVGPTPEVRGSSPVIGKINVYCQLYRKGKNKEKEAENVPLKKLLEQYSDFY